jgi:hypothetical protein
MAASLTDGEGQSWNLYRLGPPKKITSYKLDAMGKAGYKFRCVFTSLMGFDKNEIALLGDDYDELSANMPDLCKEVRKHIQKDMANEGKQ